jgi:diacylglycerol kinase (ATP)
MVGLIARMPYDEIMPAYAHIVIIFNPKSTGDSPQLARDFARNVRTRFPKTHVHLKETQHAGHAEALAYDATRQYDHLLLVSVSGDGGYNELINGMLRAHTTDGTPLPACALIPGGNANDHHSRVYTRPLLEALEENAVQPLDVIKITAGNNVRYAHSYVSLGLSAHIAHALQKQRPSRLREIVLGIQVMRHFRSFSIVYGEERRSFVNFVVGNIDLMGKYFHLSKGGKPNDGKLELWAVPAASKWRMVIHIIRALISGAPSPAQTQHLKFTTVKPLTFQYDGEIGHLPARTEVTVSCLHHTLRIVC